MKVKHLAFYVIFAIFIIGITLLPNIHVTNEVVLKNKEIWEYGFGYACAVLGAVLLLAAVASHKGSKFGGRVCLWWGTIYSIIIGSITIWHYPNSVLFTLVAGVIWGVCWFLFSRSLLKQVSV